MRERAPSRVRRAAALAAMLIGLLPACRKTERSLREPPPAAARVDTIRVSDLQPGFRLPEKPVRNPYDGNAFAISDGQRLYDWYNCSGCHSRGGGGMGPPLMDRFWIYGSSPQNIFASIVEGRPNGMPSWRGKIPNYQVWQIVAYVQAMQADKPIAAPPGPRQDHLHATAGTQSR